MAKSAFYRAVTAQLLKAGCEFVRPSHGHDIYRGLTGRTVTVPRKLDDKGVVHEILKRAGLKNDPAEPAAPVRAANLRRADI